MWRISRPPRFRVQEYRHARDRLGPLSVRDVETRYQPWHDLEAQEVLKLEEDVIGPWLRRFSLAQLVGKDVPGVDHGKLHQPDLRTPLRHVQGHAVGGSVGKHLAEEGEVGETGRKQDLARELFQPRRAARQIGVRNRARLEARHPMRPRPPVMVWVSRPISTPPRNPQRHRDRLWAVARHAHSVPVPSTDGLNALLAGDRGQPGEGVA